MQVIVFAHYSKNTRIGYVNTGASGHFVKKETPAAIVGDIDGSVRNGEAIDIRIKIIAGAAQPDHMRRGIVGKTGIHHQAGT